MAAETSESPRHPDTYLAVLAGVVTAVVGFTSSFAVVLAGLTAMGASPDQAASGLAVVCLTMGLGCLLFALRYRIPLTMAWSTPGAALLATTATPRGGYAAAVGAFVLVGVLLAATGLVRQLGDAVRRIPTAIANAMLAGILLHLTVQPFADLAHRPATIGPLVITWLVLLRFARRWAVPGALAAAVVVMAVTGTFGHIGVADLVPRLTWTTPTFAWDTMVAVALPLYIVTMTSQNIPGVAVLAAFGYRAPVRPALAYTGTMTVVGAPFGGYAINLSAIAAALAAGPEAGRDPGRRWLAAAVCGVGYMSFGPLSQAVTAVSQAAPAGLLAAIAGLALVASFAAAASTAMGDLAHRESAAVTFLVAASGISVAGIGAAFWALLAGLAVHLVLTAFRPGDGES